MCFAGVFEILFELVDALLEHFAISLKLLNLESVTLDRFFRSAVVLRPGRKRKRVSFESCKSECKHSHPPRLGDDSPQSLRLFTSLGVVPLHRVETLSTLLEAFGEFRNVALERTDLAEVLFLVVAEFLLFPTFRLKLRCNLWWTPRQFQR